MKVIIKNFKLISGITEAEVKHYFERLVYLMDQSDITYFKDISSCMNVEFEIKKIEDELYHVIISRKVIEWVIA